MGDTESDTVCIGGRAELWLEVTVVTEEVETDTDRDIAREVDRAVGNMVV